MNKNPAIKDGMAPSTLLRHSLSARVIGSMDTAPAILAAAADFLASLRERSWSLYRTAQSQLVLLVVFLTLLVTDERLVLGINPWIKPIKFSLSIFIYTMTMAWLISFLANDSQRRRLSGWISGTMLVEIVAIAFQSWRGVPSHFNQSTAFNGAIFSLMGVAILINTGVVVRVWLLLRRDEVITKELRSRPLLRASLPWAFGIFLVGSAVGGLMAQLLRHTIGAPDGGPGLPFLNWSLVAGDLRVAHFLGLHSLQLLPIAALWLERLQVTRPRMMLHLLGVGYSLVCLLLLVLALLGVPVLPLG